MNVKLKKGTTITAKHEGGTFWEIDDTVVFTDVSVSGVMTYNDEGKKIFFPKDHDLSGVGFTEDMFDIPMPKVKKKKTELVDKPTFTIFRTGFKIEPLGWLLLLIGACQLIDMTFTYLSSFF